MRRRAALLVFAILGAACGGGAATENGGSTGSVATSGAGGSGGKGGAGGAGGSASRPFRAALSVSPFSGALFQSGAIYSDGQSTATDVESLEAMYIAHGGNEVFARISTELAPTGSPDDHSLKTALSRAALAKKLGLPFNPELGLWAHYGDIGCEPAPDFAAFPEIAAPGPWNTLSVDQMVPVLTAYGALVAKEILETGVTVNVWDIGNEVDFGTAGVAPVGFNCSTPYVAPDGVDPAIGKESVVNLLSMSETDRIAWLGAHVWPHEARLLAAVAAGIRGASPSARFATHMSQSLSATFALAFYDAMAGGGFSPDEIGFSYYPSATSVAGRAAKFRDTVMQVEDHFNRPVFIAEVAYPAGPTTGGAYSTWTNAIPAYPIGEAGQAAMLRDLASFAKASKISGIRPWAPEVFVTGWEGFALFELPMAGAKVVARKSLDSIAEGIAAPDPNAFHD